MSFFFPSPLPNPAAAEFSTPGREAKPKAFLEGHLADLSPPALRDPAGTMLLPMPSQNVSTFLTLCVPLEKQPWPIRKDPVGKGSVCKQLYIGGWLWIRHKLRVPILLRDLAVVA